MRTLPWRGWAIAFRGSNGDYHIANWTICYLRREAWEAFNKSVFTHEQQQKVRQMRKSKEVCAVRVDIIPVQP